MMRNKMWIFRLALLLLGGISTGAAAAERVAMIIGNSSYRELRALDNAGNDADAVAGRLQQLGFSLIGVDGTPSNGAIHDLDENSFVRSVKAFARASENAEVALIYYAGHGMQIEGESYLLPVDAPLSDIDLLERNSIRLEGVLRQLDGRARLTVAVFDACREIPELEERLGAQMRSAGLGASSFRGLSRVKSRGRSRIVAYSGAAGERVKDGTGSHSPYTALLLEHLGQKQQEMDKLFQTVSFQFGQRYGGQNPEVLIQGVEPGRYFLPPLNGPSAEQSRATPTLAGRDLDAEIELTFWNSVKDSDNAGAFQAYLKRYPEGRFAPIAHTRVQAITSTITDREALFVVGEILAASNAADVERIVRLYAEPADYFSKRDVGRDFIRQDKRSYYKRWPEVKNERRGGISITDTGRQNEKLITFEIQFEVYNPSRKKGISGTAQNRLLLRKEHGEVLIRSMSQKVLSRHKW